MVNFRLSILILRQAILVGLLAVSSLAWAIPASETEVLMGAEVELQERHLVAFANYLDMDDLQNRMLPKILEKWKFVSGSSAWLKPQELKEIKQRYSINVATFDFPIVISNFFQIVDPAIRSHILTGLEETYREVSSPLVMNNSFPAQDEKAKKSSGGIILQEQVRANTDQRTILSAEQQNPATIAGSTGPREIIVGSSPDQIRKTKMEMFWSEVNRRWNDLPLENRLSAIAWKYWPLSSKAKLMSGFYSDLHRLTFAQPGDRDFIVDEFEFKFLDPRVQSLFNEYYVRPDMGRVAEFHTLEPQPYQEFIPHLKRLLTFVNQDRSILHPTSSFRKDTSLHVHISSPYWVDLEEFKSFGKSLKFYVALLGLSKGYPDTFGPLHYLGSRNSLVTGLAPNVFSKDVARVVHDEPRFEVRMFFEDVEKELLFYNQLARLPLKQARRLLNAKIDELLTIDRVYRIASLNPFFAHRLIGVDRLQSMNLSADQLNKFVEIQFLNASKMGRTASDYLEKFSLENEINQTSDPAFLVKLHLMYLKKMVESKIIQDFSDGYLPKLLIKRLGTSLTSGFTPILTEAEYQSLVKSDKSSWGAAPECKSLLK